MGKRTAALVAAAGATVVAATSPASAGSPVEWGPPVVVSMPAVEQVALDWSSATTSQWTADATPTVVQGDFDGDGLDDVFLYVAGSTADQLWLSQPFDEVGGDTDRAGRFVTSTINVSGEYRPFAGDFDGNGADDIFWYAPGSQPDSIWYFEGGTIAESKAVSVGGVYQPIVADFDQNDGVPSDDIFWYGQANSESVWSGRSDGTFQTRTFATQAPANAKVLLGNFAPDNAMGEGVVSQDFSFPDLFFYVPGSGADAQWNGNGTGGYTVVSRTVSGDYKPIVGNFDQGRPAWLGGLSDIFWYAPGTGADTIWINKAGTFVGSKVTVNGRYTPFVVPGTVSSDAIVWNNPSGSDSLWIPNGVEGAWSYQSKTYPGADMVARTPVIGWFDDSLSEYDVFGLIDVAGVNPFTMNTNDVATPGPEANVVVDPQVLTIVDEMPRADVLWISPGSAAGQSEVFWRVDGTDVTYQQTEVQTPITIPAGT